MDVRFHSTVLITRRLSEMKRFYTELLGQQVRFDFGNCMTLECALTLWQPHKDYVLSKAMSGEFGGNSGMEVCFEADEDFDAEAARIKAGGAVLVHDVAEEAHGVSARCAFTTRTATSWSLARAYLASAAGCIKRA